MKLRRRIFLGCNITGEGFRARQQFQDGIVQFAGYDAIYPKVIAEESPAYDREDGIFTVTDADRCTGRCEETL